MSQPIASVVPSLRYRDAGQAVDFLCRAFGFERHLVVPGETGGVVHAQLQLGNGLVMLGDAGHAEFDRWVKPLSEIGGVSAQSVYVIVSDVDAHCEKARAAGAEILMEPHDPDYGGRVYSCRDPEGHVWSFGSYDPLAAG